MYAGIDQSYSNTGIVILDENGQLCSSKSIKFNKLDRSDRLLHIYDVFDAFIKENPNKYWALEDYAYNSQFSREKLGEIGGIVKLALLKNGIEPHIIPIKTHRKLTCGNGNLKKEAAATMIKTIYRVDFESLDEFDAFSIAYALYLKIERDLNFYSKIS